MRGEKVIVRTYGDIPVVCKVWDFDRSHNRVLVCDENGFAEMVRGTAPRPDCFPIPFPRNEVFKFDEKAFEKAQSHVANPAVWGQLQPWAENHV